MLNRFLPIGLGGKHQEQRVRQLSDFARKRGISVVGDSWMLPAILAAADEHPELQSMRRRGRPKTVIAVRNANLVSLWLLSEKLKNKIEAAQGKKSSNTHVARKIALLEPLMRKQQAKVRLDDLNSTSNIGRGNTLRNRIIKGRKIYEAAQKSRPNNSCNRSLPIENTYGS